MLELVKLLLLVVVVYTGAQALNNTINKIDVLKLKGRPNQVTKMIDPEQ